MNPMNLIIADDEPLARQRLMRMLEPLAHIKVVAECDNGKETLMATGEHNPDVVLLDIRMPEMDGLETAQHLASLDKPPAIIFVTAYDEYALKAFDSQAMAYLLKPVRKNALEEALQRCDKLNQAQLRALDSLGDEPKGRRHIVAKSMAGMKLIDVEHIYYFQAEQKYVTVYHRDGETLIGEPLKQLEDELGTRFVRIHRNALVNTAYLESIHLDADKKTRLYLRGVEEGLEISRRHMAEVKRCLQADACAA